jgi:hypothetical protein
MQYVVVNSYWDRSGIIQIAGPFSEVEAERVRSEMTADPDLEGFAEIMPLGATWKIPR